MEGGEDRVEKEKSKREEKEGKIGQGRRYNLKDEERMKN